MSSNIPDMLAHMDDAIHDIWQRHVESLTALDFADYSTSCQTYRELVSLRKHIDQCLFHNDDLRLEVLPLLLHEPGEKEN